MPIAKVWKEIVKFSPSPVRLLNFDKLVEDFDQKIIEAYSFLVYCNVDWKELEIMME